MFTSRVNYVVGVKTTVGYLFQITVVNVDQRIVAGPVVVLENRVFNYRGRFLIVANSRAAQIIVDEIPVESTIYNARR